MNILVLNEGSSSHKGALYVVTDVQETPPAPSWEGRVVWQHPDRMQGQASLEVKSATQSFHRQIEASSPAHAIGLMLATIEELSVLPQNEVVEIVGHRVVHGGGKYQEPTPISEEVKRDIEAFAELAPLHNRIALEGIRAVEKRFSTVPQLAVFDTAFHSTLPEEGALYAGPYEWKERGFRRYGFHGISHQYVAARAAKLLQRDPHSLRLVSCHLGNGCSVTAIQNGKSVATTMGFTPLEGLMMGTRSGSVDPGLLLHLLKKGHYTLTQLEEVLERHSGLLGISGISHSMQEIEEAMHAGNSRAQLAFRMFVHRLCWHIGAMAACLGGVDALIFTGGIGENSALVREAACRQLAFLGIAIEDDKNKTIPEDGDITTPASPTRVLVIRTQEEWAIAQACWQFQQQAR